MCRVASISTCCDCARIQCAEVPLALSFLALLLTQIAPTYPMVEFLSNDPNIPYPPALQMHDATVGCYRHSFPP